MSKRGLGGVVAVVLIVLISIIAVSIFLAVYFKSVKKSTSDDSALCLGIDVGVKNCYYFNYLINYVNPPIPGMPVIRENENALLMNVERFPGGGEIKSLRFEVEGVDGNKYSGKPIDINVGLFKATTNYTDFVEYSSVEAIIRDIPSAPKSVTVGAVVGDSETVCVPVRVPVKCEMFRTS